MAYGPRDAVIYHSDILDVDFLMSEPHTLVTEASRGWAAPAGGAGKIPRRPERVTPRHVIGVDASGHFRRATVATTAADLWTGAAVTFTTEVGEVCTVTGYVGEKATARTF